MIVSVGSSGGSAACLYGMENNGWPYLATGLFDQVQRLPLEVGQDADAVLQRLGAEVQWFVWHTFFTFKGTIPKDRAHLSTMLKDRSIFSVNERVTDISKRHVQDTLARLGLPTTRATAQGAPDERLFLKSNHNYGGNVERRTERALRDYFGIALPDAVAPNFSDYKAAERRAVLPAAFEIEDLFIERFITNAAEVFYRAFVAYDAVVLSRMVCRGIIKKAADAEQREDYFLSFADTATGFASAPDDTARRIMIDLARFCGAFGLDFGAIDVLIDDDGIPYISDVNPTPWGGPNLQRPGLVAHLTEGFRAFA